MLSQERLEEDEYEMQFYGFSSTIFFDDFEEEVKYTFKKALKGIEKIMLEEIPDFPKNQEPIFKEQIMDLYKCFLKKIEAPLKKLEETSREIFRISPHVSIVSEEDRITKKYSENEVKKLEAEVEELEKKFLQEKAFQLRLKAEKALQDQLQALISHTNKKLRLMQEAKNAEKDINKFKECVHMQNDFLHENKIIELRQMDSLKSKFHP